MLMRMGANKIYTLASLVNFLSNSLSADLVAEDRIRAFEITLKI